MSQRSLIWPLGVMMVVLIIIVSALTGPTAPSAAPARQDSPCSEEYPEVYPACATETAEIKQTSEVRQTNFARQNDDDDNDDNDNETTTDSNTNNTQNTATPTSTQTATLTPTTIFEVDEDEAESEPTNTPRSIRQQATETPTSTLIPDSDILTCVPGVPVVIEGQGPSNAALLLYFDERPVGGTSGDARGIYSLQLVIGEERPGDYPLEVQVRGTRELVDEFICRVPGGGTPTPTETN